MCYLSPDRVPDKCLVLLSVPDRQVSGSGEETRPERQHFGFLFSISIFWKNTKRGRDIGVGGGGGRGVGSLSFNIHEWGRSPPIRTHSDTEKGGGGHY